jgi:hypothetical protein
MKKIALLGVLAAAVLLSACAKDQAPCPAQPTPAPAAVHHDYKGEVNR